MARDYAKGGKRRKPATRRKSGKSAASGRGGALRAYFAGLLSGVFISFLVYLATLPPGESPGVAEAPTPQPKPAEPEVSFEFYERLKEQRVEVEAPAVEPAANVARPREAAPDVYLLQAGAFRQREDADSRRAQLIFLGLEPTIQASGAGAERLYRVYLGPYVTRQAMNKARALTAGEGIETLTLKRPRD
jgi:cell division protein FtsN